MTRILALAIVILSVTSALWAQELSLPQAAWKEGGVVVNDSPGNTLQQNPQICDSSILVFEDFRQGQANLYAQKLDIEGNVLWGEGGLPICEAPGDQNFPRIISDGVGGAIIVWQDDRAGNFDIYAQRLDAQGRILWEKDGVMICVQTGGQVFPELTTDGAGGAVITWHDYRRGSEDIFAQRITADGILAWQVGGVPVCLAEGTQWYPRIVSDGRGGAIICWADRRSQNFDIYAQKLDESGRILWMENGVAVCSAEGNQEHPAPAADGQGGAIIAWNDLRTEAPGIYFQKIISDGTPAYAPNGSPASLTSAGASFPQIAEGKKGGALIAWSDPHAGDPDVYAQLVDDSGNILWGEEGRAIAKINGPQENPRIFGKTPWLIVWEDGRNANRQLYSQKILESGYFAYSANGVLLSRKGRDMQNASAYLTAAGEAMVSFQDRRLGNFDIFAQKIGRKGELLWGEAGVMVCDVPGSVVQQNVKMISDAYGNFLVAFEDFRNGYSNIYLQKLNKQGGLLWGRDGVAVAGGGWEQRNPEVVSDGGGGAIVAWEDSRVKDMPRIFAQRITTNGKPYWAEKGVVLTQVPALQSKPQVVADGAGGAVVIFCDYKGTLSFQDIYAQRLNAQGEILWGPEGKVVSAANGNQDEPKIAPRSLVLVWTDYRNGDRNSDIYAQKINLEGRILWAEDGIPVCEAPDSQREPQIIDNGEQGVIIAWTDRGGGGYDIYAQRVDAYGRGLWIKDGIPVIQAARTQQRAKMTLIHPATALLVWEDFRYGNWDIMGQKLSDQGRILFPEEGIPVCRALGTQYAPVIVSVLEDAVIGWEDYRNGHSYQIFLQKLSLNGQALWGEDGYGVVETSGGGRAPQLVSTKDGAILAWEDYRNGGRAIYAQRFTF